MKLFSDKYKNIISGKISCYDRVILTGTLPQICYSKGMTSYLKFQKIRIFDYSTFAEQFKEKIRKNAEQISHDNNITIEFIKKKHIRKETIVQKVIEQRGAHPGLVHIISAMESCSSYKPWHDKATHKTYLKGDTSKCLHYYFYFIDDVFGLGYIRVPTWCPFKLQVYFNGHNWLASSLDKEKIKYTMLDNSFEYIEDFQKAQEISDDFQVFELHKFLDRLSEKYCPICQDFNQMYHWSAMQVEYATDIVFKNQKDLQIIYDTLISTAIHTVKPDNIATFLGKKLTNFQGEAGNNYNIRIEGSRLKHSMGKVSIKMYDKFKKILRIETTTNDLTFFKHYRYVEHKDGSRTKKNAAMKKSIYSLKPLTEILNSANRRYIEFISTLEDNSMGKKRLTKVTKDVKKNERTYKGFNFFKEEDLNFLRVIIRGEFNISGFQNRNIRKVLKDKNTGQVSRMLKRLKEHGLIKKVRNTYKYYLTKLGKVAIITGLKIEKLYLIPQLNY